MGSCPSKPGEPGYTGPPASNKSCNFKVTDRVKRLGVPYGKLGEVVNIAYTDNMCSSVTVKYDDGSVDTNSPSFFKLLSRESCPFKVGDRVVHKTESIEGVVDQINFLDDYSQEQDVCTSVKVLIDSTGRKREFDPADLELKKAAPKLKEESTPTPAEEPAAEPEPSVVPLNVEPPQSAVAPPSKVDEFVEYINSKLPLGLEWQNLDRVKESIQKVIELLGDDTSVKITDKQPGDTNISTGTKFVNVEIRSDGKLKWMSKPLPDNLDNRIVQQKGGAVVTYKFVIYNPPKTAGSIRVKTQRKKITKKSRKTRRI